MSLVLKQRERRRRRDLKKKQMIRVRYNYTQYKMIETEDHGTFAQMLKKYKGKYQFWCADSPPTKGENGQYDGFRLDSDTFPEHEFWCLYRYGKHKAWIDPTHKVAGKPVVLVFNAQFDVGTFGTVTSASVGINTVARLNREKRRKARMRARKARKAKWRTNRRTKRKYRR